MNAKCVFHVREVAQKNDHFAVQLGAFLFAAEVGTDFSDFGSHFGQDRKLVILLCNFALFCTRHVWAQIFLILAAALAKTEK